MLTIGFVDVQVGTSVVTLSPKSGDSWFDPRHRFIELLQAGCYLLLKQ
jgi:hypothetical protein